MVQQQSGIDVVYARRVQTLIISVSASSCMNKNNKCFGMNEIKYGVRHKVNIKLTVSY